MLTDRSHSLILDISSKIIYLRLSFTIFIKSGAGPAKNPKLLLCDEPTGALDYQTGKAILKLLQDTCRQKGMTVVVITHNMAIAPMADQVIRFKNGQVRNITRNSEPTPVEQIEW